MIIDSTTKRADFEIHVYQTYGTGSPFSQV